MIFGYYKLLVAMHIVFRYHVVYDHSIWCIHLQSEYNIMNL